MVTTYYTIKLHATNILTSGDMVSETSLGSGNCGSIQWVIDNDIGVLIIICNRRNPHVAITNKIQLQQLIYSLSFLLTLKPQAISLSKSTKAQAIISIPLFFLVKSSISISAFPACYTVLHNNFNIQLQVYHVHLQFA